MKYTKRNDIFMTGTESGNLHMHKNGLVVTIPEDFNVVDYVNRSKAIFSDLVMIMKNSDISFNTYRSKNIFGTNYLISKVIECDNAYINISYTESIHDISRYNIMVHFRIGHIERVSTELSDALYYIDFLRKENIIK